MKIYKEFISGDIEGNYVSESFGLDRGYKNVVLDLNVPDNLNGITYITGDSGCGKTTLFKELACDKISLSIPDTPLYMWGELEPEKSLYLLSSVGLGDAVLFTSTYDVLSDSQKARARIYLQLINDRTTIIFDEFLSTLDRNTAKAVAFTFQKIIRRNGLNAIVATAHNDLIDYLQPDLLIEGKAFPSRWKVTKNTVEISNPFISSLSFKYEDKVWYRNLALGELHYKGKYTGGTKEYLGCYYNDNVIGVLVSTYRMHDGGRRISRVVIHPSYRGCGIGVELVKRYLVDFPNCDVVASMARFNPVFEKAGMINGGVYEHKPSKDLIKWLKSEGFEFDKWHSKKYCGEFCESERIRFKLSNLSGNVGFLVTPAGTKLSKEDVSEKIRNELFTASRVLWGLRPRLLKKYKGVEA